MDELRIKAGHRSGWFVVVLPTALFLLVLFGTPYLFHSIGLQGTGYMLLGLAVGLVAALVASVATHPIFRKIAEQGRGEIRIAGTLVEWTVGNSRKSLDLGRPYRARIAACDGTGDESRGVGIDLHGDGAGNQVNIHIGGADVSDVLGRFQHRHFIDDLIIKPGEGAFGFELDIGDAGVRQFLDVLLGRLLDNRMSNRAFLAFDKFPWQSEPRPQATGIRKIQYANGPASNREFIETLRRQAISSPVPWLSATQDHVFGYLDEPGALPVDILAGNNEPSWYFVLPLGSVTAVPGTRRLSITSATRVDTTLVLEGPGEHGEQMELVFGWLPAFPHSSLEALDEADAFMRFLNR